MTTNMEKRGPWTTLNEELRYETPWIAVSHHDVIDPGGRQGIYGVVHFKNLAIGIVPLDEDLNTWIVGQYRYPVQAYSWEIPEGGGRRDIPPLLSAQRELREEAGIVAERWTELLHMDLSNSASDEHAIIYLARGLSFHPPQPDHDEELVLRVRDSGVGIAPKFLPHVFERFRQADSGAARPFGGLGLGLSIVKELTERHGGQVTAHSAGAGTGATFTVRIPARVAGGRRAGAARRAGGDA